jgi:hypothetical protein
MQINVGAQLELTLVKNEQKWQQCKNLHVTLIQRKNIAFTNFEISNMRGRVFNNKFVQL